MCCLLQKERISFNPPHLSHISSRHLTPNQFVLARLSRTSSSLPEKVYSKHDQPGQLSPPDRSNRPRSKRRSRSSSGMSRTRTRRCRRSRGRRTALRSSSRRSCLGGRTFGSRTAGCGGTCCSGRAFRSGGAFGGRRRDWTGGAADGWAARGSLTA